MGRSLRRRPSPAGRSTPRRAARRAVPAARRIPVSRNSAESPARRRRRAISIINFEVWIPTDSSFNGKYEQLGCGGFCGSIGYGGLANAITRGYAAAATDDGSQTGGQPTFAVGHLEKVIDFGYRALKETTDKSKTIIATLTGQGPQRSYFNGCSDGGREALMEAQRYPDDFDGIIVGSPANFWTHLFTGFVWNEQALLDNPASYIPPSLLPVLSKAALAHCVGQDGGVKTDVFLNDPRDCHFDPAAVQMRTGTRSHHLPFIGPSDSGPQDLSWPSRSRDRRADLSRL
jgi:Tannase and feruloyl esterase